MRRARIAVALATLALAFCAPHTGRAAQGVTRISGIGILDYTREPTFKVGDYVRYAVTTLDDKGNPIDQYNLTVLIAGQELWWGERCFYIETWMEDGRTQQTPAVNLMSYSIFSDSLWEEHLQSYMRKTVMGYDADAGKLMELLVTPKPSSLTARASAAQPHTIKRDTLGADTVQTPRGVMPAIKVAMRQAWGNTGAAGDSTIYKELNEVRTQWICDSIPLTRYAREETVSRETRKAWFIGRSKEAAAEVQVAGGGLSARVVGYGHGLKSIVLPDDRIHSFDDPPAVKKPAPAAKPKTAAAKAGAAGGAKRR